MFFNLHFQRSDILFSRIFLVWTKFSVSLKNLKFPIFFTLTHDPTQVQRNYYPHNNLRKTNLNLIWKERNNKNTKDNDLTKDVTQTTTQLNPV